MKPPALLPLLFACLLLAGLILSLLLLPEISRSSGLQPVFYPLQSQSVPAGDADVSAGTAALRTLPWTLAVVAVILLTLWFFVRRNRK